MRIATLQATLRLVRKTSIYLSEAEQRRLAALAGATGRSQSQLVRDAIAAYVPASDVRRFAMAGCANSGQPAAWSIADVPEEELLRGFGE